MMPADSERPAASQTRAPTRTRCARRRAGSPARRRRARSRCGAAATAAGCRTRQCRRLLGRQPDDPGDQRRLGIVAERRLQLHDQYCASSKNRSVALNAQRDQPHEQQARARAPAISGRRQTSSSTRVAVVPVRSVSSHPIAVPCGRSSQLALCAWRLSRCASLWLIYTVELDSGRLLVEPAPDARLCAGDRPIGLVIAAARGRESPCASPSSFRP